MRVTVDIDEETLKQVKQFSQIAKISPAISFVVADWLRQKELKAFVDSVMENPPGYGYTNEELESKLYDDVD